MIAKEVMDSSGALLNDTALSIFTYTTQVPYLNIALDELQEQLELNNVTITNKTAGIITVKAGIEGIGGGNGQPALPDNLIEPINLYERTSGSQFSFAQMRKYDFIPMNQIPSAFLIYWSWEGDTIHFIPGGATGNIDIEIHYVRSIFTKIASEKNEIPYKKAKTFLIYRNAALCAEFIGENLTRAQELNAFAIIAMDRALGINTKGRQSVVTRRRPFMAGWRARRII